MDLVSYGSPLTLYGTAIVWSPHVHMVSPNVKCLHVFYDSHGPPIPYMEYVSDGPPYLIWNRYHMVPPHMYYMIFSGQLRKRSTARTN